MDENIGRRLVSNLVVFVAILFIHLSCVAQPLVVSVRLPREVRPDCLTVASNRYAVPVLVLMAILKVESGGRVGVVSKNSDGSVDYGPAQINSRYWARFVESRFGISSESLVNDFCQAVLVQAYILRSEANSCLRRGDSSIWCAVGRYHSARPDRQAAYVRRVWAASTVLMRSGRF
ncbi:lytic transglycosylase domain-containing protein [Cupriavidus necator]